MAFPGQCARVLLSGALPGGDRWASGFYREDIDDGVTMQSYAATIRDSSTFQSFYTALIGIFATGTTLDQIDTYRYETGRAAVDHGVVSVTGAQSAITPSMPNQSALVLTLRSSNTSRSGRGRMYLPYTRPGTDSTTGLVPANLVTAVVTAGWNFLEGSQAIVLSETETQKRPVVRVDADRILDTMRSRSDKLNSTRISAP